ncbi:hypothetical protein QN372_17280 [Undibacterium sp. RTI2.1]|uniref:hypothetical protein n=1 Tax=unclassified Undibacterium TaxID=2630295 RepID=UPI002AB3A4D9|nr:MULTISPECIES: hypothetical protein [unclassified Undibacterium]MDY7538191.1 hypothetical protein [Undibacterium sp. 5I1]MEB0032507.1 hypothetical protein [Undibacterium sp. RTI2.1]MEB0116791.1 hypothetical protein [Undibacterium sp. RTI2.2]MEB0229594.1 hypothetical protein [Undibacterium sp. 10I3]MEB0257327.1 hypothetical protein [Undibacterium sp. 5I1]
MDEIAGEKKPTRRSVFSSNKKITWMLLQKLLLEQKLLELHQMLELHQLLELALVLQQEQKLLLELLLRVLKLLEQLELLLFYRKLPKQLLTGKRARVIFSCLYFQ